jgi:hypothetical protein
LNASSGRIAGVETKTTGAAGDSRAAEEALGVPAGVSSAGANSVGMVDGVRDAAKAARAAVEGPGEGAITLGEGAIPGAAAVIRGAAGKVLGVHPAAIVGVIASENASGSAKERRSEAAVTRNPTASRCSSPALAPMQITRGRPPWLDSTAV